MPFSDSPAAAPFVTFPFTSVLYTFILQVMTTVARR